MFQYVQGGDGGGKETRRNSKEGTKWRASMQRFIENKLPHGAKVLRETIISKIPYVPRLAWAAYGQAYTYNMPPTCYLLPLPEGKIADMMAMLRDKDLAINVREMHVLACTCVELVMLFNIDVCSEVVVIQVDDLPPHGAVSLYVCFGRGFTNQ
jgi:hypothetical protein